MKNYKKLLAVFLSIAMVMCGTLPSLASTNDASKESTEYVEETSSGELDESEESRRGEACEPEESCRGEACEPEESCRGEACEPAEETEESSESGYAEEPEEDETTAAVEESEEDETTAVAEEETSDNNVGASSASPEETCEPEETSELEETTASEETSEDNSVGASSASPEETSESSETAESSETVNPASPSELIEIAAEANDKLLGAPAPYDPVWMYWYLTDEDGDSTSETIHFLSYDPGGATAIQYDTITGGLYYDGLVKSDITKVVFEDEIYAVTCSNFFREFTSLSSIENLTNLKTDNVKDMSYMFQYCYSLTSIDVSGFNTQELTSMRNMFNSCTQLVNLDLSNFNVPKLTTIQTAFTNCQSLMSIDLHSLDTLKITNMGDLFRDCKSLQSLDLSNFDTSKVYTMEGMFYGCNLLEKIKVSKNFVIINGQSNSNMFAGCTNLVGGAGTTFDSAHVNGEYARGDVPGTPGYFTLVWMWWYLDGTETIRYTSSNPASGGEAITNINTVEYVGLTKNSITEAIFDDEIEAVTCNNFFYDFRNLATISEISRLNTSNVKDMSGMFQACRSLTSLDLSDIDTSKVITMANMFRSSESLTSLNISGNKFNTSMVTDMQSMFFNCTGFTDLDLSDLETLQVTNMKEMFRNCTELKNLNITKFNTANVETMEGFLRSCEKLTSIDIWNFNTSNVTNIREMFMGCSSLRTIISNDFDTSKSPTSDNMFYDCGALVGCMGTGFDSTKIDKEFARIDEGPTSTKPGYLSKAPWMYWYLEGSAGDQTIHYTNSKPTSGDYGFVTRMDDVVYNGLSKHGVTKAVFDNAINAATCRDFFMFFTSLKTIDKLDNLKTENVQNMFQMFAECYELTSFDLSKFITTNVTDMYGMFSGCQELEELDLRGFNTTKVTNMEGMFSTCGELRTIKVSSFDTANVLYSNEMFLNCISLVGGAGTTYENSYPKDKTYARIDGGPSSATPGYFTYEAPPTPPTPSPTPYYPGGSSGSSGGSGGGGGGGGGPVTEEVPAVTYVPHPKTTAGVVSNLTGSWDYNLNSLKWKLNVKIADGSEAPVANGFYLYAHITTQIVDGNTVTTASNNEYYFDALGNMVTGWVHTSDGKTYFFENKKTNDEGKMIIGWKQIQGDWYCFGPDGAMYKDTITSDGYPVGPDGKWRG